MKRVDSVYNLNLYRFIMKLRLPKLLMSALMAAFCSATFSAAQNCYDLDPGDNLTQPVFGISSPGDYIYSYFGDGSFISTLNGDVILNGRGAFGSGEQYFPLDAMYSGGFKPVVIFETSEYYSKDSNYGITQLHITGSLTIQSETAIVFSHSATGDYNPSTGWDTWHSEYQLPNTSNYIIRCGSVDENSLSLLKPYLMRCDYADNYETKEYSGGMWGKSLDGYGFYAKAGTSGTVEIYLEKEGGAVEPETPPVTTSTVTINTSVPTESDIVGTEVYQWSDCNLLLNGSWLPEIAEEYYGDKELYPLLWSGDGNYTMTGSGTIGNGNDWVELSVEGSGVFTIESDIAFAYSEITVGLMGYNTSGPAATLIMKGTMEDCELYVAHGLLDLTNARFIGQQNSVDLGVGTTLRAENFTISPNTSLYVYSGGSSNLDGNLIINSTIGNFKLNGTEQKFYWDDGPRVGTVTFYSDVEPYGRLDITGNLIVKSQSLILFENHNLQHNESTDILYSEYLQPAEDLVCFTCSGVTKDSLNLLVPVIVRNEDSEVYDDDELIAGEDVYFYKQLTERKFYAKAGENGVVEICLGNLDAESEPSIPGNPPVSPELPDPPEQPTLPPTSIVVGGGATIELGKTEETTPSTSMPVYIQGGVADASQLADELLNNIVIKGTNGTLITVADQKMNITDGGELGFSIVGVDASVPGADLEIAVDKNIELSGKQYNTASVTVSKGTLSIDSGTSLGMGADDTEVVVKETASLTNFGTVKGDVSIDKNATMLNQGKIQGDIELQSAKSTLVNNGAVTGDIMVGNGALLSGSGSAENLVLKAGAALNVGNSPGWQKYDSVAIARGSYLTFTVDGTTPASATNIGEGTHSVLQTDTLTIGDGSDTVKVTVNVTMGIVAAGDASITVKLVDAGASNAKADDFTISLNDNGLLEDGADVVWDTATQSLSLTGSVNKGVLSALMDRNSANVANSMWASANAVQEMARVAEGQFLIGMPGQTTCWGAGLGSFMEVSGDSGFTCNMGGYAVGMQHAVTESFRIGVALGQVFGSFKSDDDQLKVDQMALMPTLTAQYVTPMSQTSSLSISGHISYGEIENEADTYQPGTVGRAEWDDAVFNIGVRTSWNKQLSDNTTASFFTGLTYQSVEQDSFTEKYTGGEREYRSGSMSSLSLPLGVTWRGVYGMGGTNIFVPEVTVAYIRDIVRDNPEVKTSVYGFNRVGKGTNLGRDAFMLTAGANWMFDSSWSVGAFYSLEARSSQVNQSVSASLRYSF